MEEKKKIPCHIWESNPCPYCVRLFCPTTELSRPCSNDLLVSEDADVGSGGVVVVQRVVAAVSDDGAVEESKVRVVRVMVLHLRSHSLCSPQRTAK